MSQHSSPRAVLFDVGMTLVHPDGEVLVDELRREGVTGVTPADAVAALQLSCDAAHLRLPAGTTVERRTGLVFAASLDVPAPAAVAALTRALTERDLYRELDPDADRLLRDLRAGGVALGVVSNSDGTLLAELERWSLLDHFDVVVDSTVAGVAKPDPRIFALALDRLGLTGDRCWYVGDHVVNDVLGAAAAGFATTVLYDRFDLYPHVPGVLHVHALAEIAGHALAPVG